MAINPATGLEDPNYTPPEETALGGEVGAAVEEPTVQEGEGALGGVPSLELSDMDPEFEKTRGNLEDITDWSQGEMGSVEKGEVGYESPDFADLKDKSGLEKGTSYLDPEGTVQDQLSKLLDEDSKYMEVAERRAKEQAASLGLLGSSMAVGAAHRAAIEKALPIAQQDAKTYAEFMLNEQKTANEMSRMKMESDLSAAAREHMYDIDTEKTKFSKQMDLIAQQAANMGNAEIEMSLQKAKLTWDAETKEHLARLDAELTMKMNQQEIDAREREYASKTSSQIMAAAYGTINDLMGNADFMAGYADNPEGLTRVFNNFINLAKDQVRFIGGTAGLLEEYTDPESGYLSLIGEWQTVAAPAAPAE